MLTFRPLVEDDLALICTFARTAKELSFCFPRARFPLTVAQLAQAVAPRFGATVVERQGRVCGMADLYLRPEGCCAIGHVVVDAEARGLGLGRELIRAMIALAEKTSGADEVRVACFSTNTVGLLLYHSLGFAACGLEERRDHLGRRVILVHLRLPRKSV